SHGEKFHPFCAPFMTHIEGNLDIDLMKKGAKFFEGQHNFINYCYRPDEDKNCFREIYRCEIKENTIYEANFFPEKTYLMHVRGKGFMRYQVRMMMGMLFRLGLGQISFEEFKSTLS